MLTRRKLTLFLLNFVCSVAAVMVNPAETDRFLADLARQPLLSLISGAGFFAIPAIIGRIGLRGARIERDLSQMKQMTWVCWGVFSVLLGGLAGSIVLILAGSGLRPAGLIAPAVLLVGWALGMWVGGLFSSRDLSIV